MISSRKSISNVVLVEYSSEHFHGSKDTKPGIRETFPARLLVRKLRNNTRYSPAGDHKNESTEAK